MRYTSVIVLMGTSAAQSSRRAALGTGQGLASLRASCLDPTRTISAGIAPRGLSIGYTESSAFHVKPAYELPASRADEGVYGSFVCGTACFERKALPPSLMCFKCNARQTMLPARHRNVWTLMHRQGCWHIRPWSMHAQCSAIVFHVKPGADRTHWPIQHVSVRSTARAPFSHSLSHRVPLRDQEGQNRGETSGMHGIAMTRAARQHGETRERGIKRAGHKSALIVGMGQCQRRGQRRDT